jgi:OmpA-OmpF porin, OOP family
LNYQTYTTMCRLYHLLPIYLYLLIPLVGYADHACCRKEIKADSLVVIQGKVLSSLDNVPVKAKLTFEKQPYGDNFYISSSDASNGNYKIAMMLDKAYSVQVQADGYLSLYATLDVNEISPNGVVLKNFVLIPNMVGQLLRMEKLLFRQSKADIVESSYEELDALVKMLEENPKMIIQLEGHTEPRGSARANYMLSMNRVEAVKEYLVNKGIKKKRIKLKAFGGKNPLTNENTEEAVKRNRRVEVRILAI